MGYENPHEAIRNYCKGVSKILTPTNGGNQTKNYIPEGDLYRLIVHSKLKSAEKFERWVFDEVLPTIRQTGNYIPNMEKLAVQITQAVIQALVPAISQMLKRSSNEEIIQLCEHEVRERPRTCRRTRSTITMMALPLRQTIEDMILDSKYTYQEIITEIFDAYGVKLSRSSLCRYATKLMDEREDQRLKPLRK